MSNLSASEQLRLTLTPGLMGATASHGRWILTPHLALIDEEIRKLVLREAPERVLVVRMPPRHGKSELVSHWTPTWFMGNWPERNVLLASYEAEYAATWGRKARDEFIQVTQGPGNVLPGRISPTRQATNDWGTDAGGYMATAGVGGPFTGKGFHLGICDDLIKNAEHAQSETYRKKTWEWLTSTFWTRREPEGVMVVIGTPWHRDDYLQRLRDWDEPVRELCLPAVCESESDPLGRAVGDALWPDRYDERELEKIKAAQGPYYWAALYQQRPTTHEQAEWPEEYFENIWADEWPHAFELSATAVDASEGTKDGDPSAIVFGGLLRGLIYVDADICNRPIPQIVADAATMVLSHGSDSLAFEGNGFQKLIAPDYERYVMEHSLPIAGPELIENYSVHKWVRIRRLGGYLKRLRFRRGSRGCATLLAQLRDFPLGDHDDGPDALEMMIRQLNAAARYAMNGQADEEYAA